MAWHLKELKFCDDSARFPTEHNLNGSISEDLAKFSNLETLFIRWYGLGENNLMPLFNTKLPKLKKLTLTYINKEFRELIQKNCPNLKSFDYN